MKKVKLLQLEVDNRWTESSNNEFKMMLGEDRENCTTLNLSVNEEVCARLLEVLLPEATNQMSDMFEALTGNDSPDDVEDLPTADPFLSTSDDDEIMDERLHP